MSVLEWVGLAVTFWHKTGAVYREEHKHESESGGAGTREALKSKVTWLCSLFFFAYMGVEGTWCRPLFFIFFLRILLNPGLVIADHLA